MFDTIQKLKSATTYHCYHFLSMLTQITCLSGITIILFDAVWSANIFLPLSVGGEILIKFFLIHCVERFVRYKYR